MIMLKVLSHAQQSWLPMFWADFRKRFVNLLGFDFKKFTPALALGIITNKIKSDCVQATMSGLATNSIFLFPFCKKNPPGKSMTPRQGKTFLFHSSQQLHHLHLGPFKAF